MFVDDISIKSNETSTYDTELISYVLIKKSLTQFKLAEVLNDKTERAVTQSSVSRWKSNNFAPLSLIIELLKIAGLDWDIDKIDYRKNRFSFGTDSLTSGGLNSTVRWRIIISNKQNEEKWFNFCKKYSQELGGSTVLPVDFVLMINQIGFNFDSDFDKFIQNEFYINLLKEWIRRYQELIIWFEEIVPLKSKGTRDFRRNWLWQVAFAQAIKNQDGNVAMKYVNPYDLYYEIEAISQRSYVFHRSLVFINRVETLGLSESRLNEILIDSNPIPDLSKDSNESESLKEDSTVDTSQWSKAEQEIYKQLAKIQKELLEKLDK
jgi:hypothetical protein